MPSTAPSIPKIAHVYQTIGHLSGADMAAAIELAPPLNVLLLHGGASAMSRSDHRIIRPLIEQGIVQAIDGSNTVVIDGGTQVGIAQIIGEGRDRAHAGFALIGVCPGARVSWPGGPGASDRYPLESHHTHFILTPGAQWGDETPYMFALADALAVQAASIALLVNGGRVARQELLANAHQNREIVIVRGSGRLADQIAAAHSGDAAPPDDELAAVVRDGRLTVVDISEDPARLARLIRQKLGLGDHVDTTRRRP